MGMDASRYQWEASRTLIQKPDFIISDKGIMLVWCAIGVAGEAGEVAEIVKKGVFHQQGIDREKLLSNPIGFLNSYRFGAICQSIIMTYAVQIIANNDYTINLATACLSYPRSLQMQTYTHPLDKATDIDYLVQFGMPGKTTLGAANGKPGFAYALSTLCPHTGAHDSLIQQLKVIDVVGRCYGYTVELPFIFVDLAAAGCSTNRYGLKQLIVACRSSLIDAEAVLMQSSDRLSRMPDELALITEELRANGKTIRCSTSQPALSVAEVEAGMTAQFHSGYPR